MNFVKDYKGELMLENVWGTPGPGGQGQWKKRMTCREFNPVNERGLQGTIMYFSIEEFVLTG
jgi:hypothetical protein